MMATAVASRFAVLSIDDDGGEGSKRRQKKPDGIAKRGVATQKSDTAQKKKVKKPEPSKGSQQSAKVKSKPSVGGKGDGPKKKQAASQEQWDQWKKKDSEYVDGNFEHEMEQAILLSKLDYEEKKPLYDQAKRDTDEEKKSVGSKKGKKSNKPQAMSLEQFKNLGSAQEVTNAVPVPSPEAATEHAPEFFDRIKEDCKKALDHEQNIENRKARQSFNEEVITIAQFEETLQKKDKMIAALEEEIVKLKEELQQVKTRNKKLCNILAHGEMRDKAEVLVEVDRLQRVKDELSAEVSSLHVQLEQERSKVRALTSSDPKSKSQNKKRSASETNQ